MCLDRDGQFDENKCPTSDHTTPRSALEEEFSATTYIPPIRHTNVLEVDASC